MCYIVVLKWSVDTTKMALLRYLKLTDDSKGSMLSSSIQPQAIAQANEGVSKAIKSVLRNVDCISCTVQSYKLKLANTVVIMMLLLPHISPL